MLHDGLSLALTSEECQEETDVPTYQYQCTACEEGLEVVQKFTDDALTECPDCQGKLKKVFSAVGIVFKGSGFYRNDSRSSNSSTSPAASGKQDKPGGGDRSEGAEKADRTDKSEKKADTKGAKSDSGAAKPAASTASAA
jgi:putative FmdB family regulatory protein